MDHLEQVAGQWGEHASELAVWVMNHLVNRTDVWGRYVRRKGDDVTRAVTAPFHDARGKIGEGLGFQNIGTKHVFEIERQFHIALDEQDMSGQSSLLAQVPKSAEECSFAGEKLLELREVETPRGPG